MASDAQNRTNILFCENNVSINEFLSFTINFLHSFANDWSNTGSIIGEILKVTRVRACNASPITLHTERNENKIFFIYTKPSLHQDQTKCQTMFSNMQLCFKIQAAILKF